MPPCLAALCWAVGQRSEMASPGASNRLRAAAPRTGENGRQLPAERGPGQPQEGLATAYTHAAIHEKVRVCLCQEEHSIPVS